MSNMENLKARINSLFITARKTSVRLRKSKSLDLTKIITLTSFKTPSVCPNLLVEKLFDFHISFPF